MSSYSVCRWLGAQFAPVRITVEVIAAASEKRWAWWRQARNRGIQADEIADPSGAV